MAPAPPPPLTDTSIQLGRPDGIYIEGEEIHGSVEFRLNEPLVITHISVKLVGEVRTGNKPSSSEIAKTRSLENHDKAAFDSPLEFMDERRSIFSTSGFKMEAGDHSLPFSMKVPQYFPSTIDLPLSSVHYKLVAAINGAISVFDEVQKYISVNRICDLNDHPKSSLSSKVSKNPAKFACFNIAMVVASMKTNRCGFIPGETILVNAFISNNSTKDVQYSKLYLVQKTSIKNPSSYAKTRYKQTIVERTRGSILRNTSQVWKDETLTVPSVPPSSSDFLCRIRYWLQMDVIDTDSRKVVILKIPILIGNIPFANLYSHLGIPLHDNKVEVFRANEDYYTEEDSACRGQTEGGPIIPRYFMLRSVPNEGDTGNE